MRGSVWHIINCPNGLPRLFFYWSWRYRNRFRTYNQHLGMSPANSKALLMVRPSSNKDLVENHGNLHHPHVSGQSSRIHRNKPLVHLLTIVNGRYCCYSVYFTSRRPLTNNLWRGAGSIPLSWRRETNWNCKQSFSGDMPVMELLILIGGAYALYTVGMAIATELDYRAVNRRRK